MKKKKKKAATLLAEPIADPFKDIYLTAFHARVSFEMLEDLAQLEAWWHRKQQNVKLMSDAHKGPATADQRKIVVSKRSILSRFQKKGLLRSQPIVGVGPCINKWVHVELNDK